MLGPWTRPGNRSLPCVVENLAPCGSYPHDAPSCRRSLGAGLSPGIRSSGPGSSWASPPGSRSAHWPSRHSTIPRPSGGSAAATRGPAYPACWPAATIRATRPDFPPCSGPQIVALACLEPVAKGLHITHWTSKDLARQAVEDGIVPAISDRTIRTILDGVDLQPHRTRYWKTARLDAEFKDRAEKVLWCYANAERLARRGYWVVCVDEKPNCQVLGGPDPAFDPRLDRAAGVRVHPPRHGQHPGVPGRPQRADGGGVRRGEECQELHEELARFRRRHHRCVGPT